MTTMLSLILAFMLSIGGSPAASVNPAGCPENTGIQVPVDNNRTINRFFEDYNQKTASRPISKKILEIPLIKQPKTQMRLRFSLSLKEELRLVGYIDSMNLYQAFNQNPVNFTDPWGLRTDLNYFGTKKSYAQALNSLVVTTADKRQLGRVAEGGANIIPAIIYFIQDLAEVVTGEDYFDEDWRFRFNFSGGPILQIYSTEKRTYWEKVRDATVVYPTGKFLADTGANFILGYNDPYVMHTPVGQESRENFDRQLIPLGATGYGVYKGISAGKNISFPKYTKNRLFRKEILNTKLELNAAKQLTKMEVESVSGAHFSKRHGAQTTLEQQYSRATTGLTPDGFQGYKVASGRFLTHLDQLNVIQRANSIFEATGKKVFEFDYGKIIGEGYLKHGGDLIRTSNVLAVYKQGKLITLYPLLRVLQ